jgi:hypothetical protein
VLYKLLHESKSPVARRKLDLQAEEDRILEEHAVGEMDVLEEITKKARNNKRSEDRQPGV